METRDMNANRLQTEERKIQWLENEIKDLEYVLSSDCINRNNKLCQLQMYRELLAIKRERNVVKQVFTEMFETSIKSAVNDGLDKIETTCITALDNFCQQMDSSAYKEH